jgi:polyisoprenoid-binding protein YceI
MYCRPYGRFDPAPRKFRIAGHTCLIRAGRGKRNEISSTVSRSGLRRRSAGSVGWKCAVCGCDLGPRKVGHLACVIRACPVTQVYEITPVESTIKFGVESSVPIKGTFDKWNASLKFSSTDVRSAVLDIEIQADSVETGSGMKNSKLKSKDFFDAKNSPVITFKSTKVVQTGSNTFDVEGDFTIRGVTKSEKLTVTDNGKGTGSGTIVGTMAFDRKDYGMNSNIPFIKIANRVEVHVNMKWQRVSGPPPVFQQ